MPWNALLSKAPSTPATTSKQHCRMLQVERFFRQSRMSLQHCCWCERGLSDPYLSTRRNLLQKKLFSKYETQFYAEQTHFWVRYPLPCTKLTSDEIQFWVWNAIFRRRSVLLSTKHASWKVQMHMAHGLTLTLLLSIAIVNMFRFCVFRLYQWGQHNVNKRANNT